MEYTLLKQSTIELITGVKYRKVPSVLKQIQEKVIEEPIITTKILTDGETSIISRFLFLFKNDLAKSFSSVKPL